MSLTDYLRIVRTRWILVLACICACLLASGAAVALMPRVYQAQSTSFVALASSSADANGSSIYQGSQFAVQQVKSYTRIVSSPQVLQPVIDNLQLGTTVADLRTKITATSPTDTVLLQIQADDPDPARAAAIANAVGRQLDAVITRLEAPAAGGPSPVKVTLVRPAEVPTAPQSPRPALIVALGLVVGIAVALVAAVVRDRSDTSVRSARDLGAVTGSRPLGQVPAAIRSEVAVLPPDAAGERAESFRSVRANLHLVDPRHPPRCVAVASARPDEGRTLTACNLAASLADTGEAVCLVEADLRRPHVADYLQVQVSIGVSDVVSGTRELEDALTPWQQGRLTVLAGGTPVVDPGRILESEDMVQLLQRLRGRFDYIVVDVPPLLEVTDGAVLARAVDGTVLVARRGRSRREDLDEAVGVLASAQGRLLGTVLTGAARRRRGRGPGTAAPVDESHPGALPRLAESPSDAG